MRRRVETLGLRLALVAALGASSSLAAGCAELVPEHDRGNDRDDGRATAATVNAAVNTGAPIGSWRLGPDAPDTPDAQDAQDAPGGAVTFDVQEDGAFAGAGPCNRYFGKWTLGVEQSTIGPVGATRKMCAEDVMQLEQQYFAALGRVAGWRSTDAGIVLVDPDGAVLLSFVPAK